jgi:hypothetical protein
MQKNLICQGYENTLVSHVGMKIRVSTWSFLSVTIPSEYLFLCWKRKFGFNKKVRTKVPKLMHEIRNTSTTVRKILVPKKLLSGVCKYVKPKPISCQNQKLTQQHNWKKCSSSSREASVCDSLSVILSLRVKRGM